MKGFLTTHDALFKKTHDLDELGRACLGVDATLNDVIQPVLPLTVFAWEFCYPGDTVVPSIAEARQAFTLAEELHKATLRRLPSHCHP